MLIGMRCPVCQHRSWFMIGGTVTGATGSRQCRAQAWMPQRVARPVYDVACKNDHVYKLVDPRWRFKKG